MKFKKKRRLLTNTLNGNFEEKYAQNCLKFFIYLYIKLNDPNYVLIKATIENLK